MPVDRTQEADRGSNRTVVCCAAAILMIHGAMLAWISYVNSPNLDEPAHLVSGISHWRFGRFELYRVNPPLVRMVAAIPILFTQSKVDWSGWNEGSPYSRAEFHAGSRFVILNELDGFWYFTLARGACIPLCLVGLWAVFRWASDLYGQRAGLLAMWLYCFCPNCIAWGASITPDAMAASLGVLAAYLFWKWLSQPSWVRTIQAGLALGLAESSKGTWIVLFVVWPLLWITQLIVQRRRRIAISEQGSEAVPEVIDSPVVTSPPFRQLAMILAIGLYLLNLSFGFEGTFKRLGEFRFISKTLSGQEEPEAGANRFAGSWWGLLPVPLPENYVRGMDVQKHDFEKGRWSYLHGQQRLGGWWYYYLLALLVKSPIGTVVLFATATLLALVRSQFRSRISNELVLVLPAVILFVLVSSQTGFSRYLRYAIPVLPFAYIHISRLATPFASRCHPIAGLLVVCSLGTALESLSAFPHCMSFFNVAVGGPFNGQSYLLDANIDWGQDLLFLKRWYDAHPEARPFHLAYFGDLDVSPAASGIISQPVPGYLPPDEQTKHSQGLSLIGPQPGWFAVSINHVMGYRHYDSDVPKYTYLQRIRPISNAGYSISIYHLTSEQANDLCSELGLNATPAPP